MDPLALEATVARVWDKDRATRLAEFRRDPYISPVLERRHNKVISEAVLDAVYPADAAAFCRHRFHIDKFKLPELMRWWHERSRAPPGRDEAREALDDLELTHVLISHQ